MEQLFATLDSFAEAAIQRDLDWLQDRGATADELAAHREHTRATLAASAWRTLAEVLRWMDEPAAPSHRLH